MVNVPDDEISDPVEKAFKGPKEVAPLF